MELQNSTSISFSLTNIVRARNASGSISVPVKPSQYLYSQLKHIKGFPAPGSNQGYSLSKLRSLDNLIDRLQGLKGLDSLDPPDEAEEANLEGLIKFYQQELKQSIDAQIPSYLGSPSLDQGLTLNITV